MFFFPLSDKEKKKKINTYNIFIYWSQHQHPIVKMSN